MSLKRCFIFFPFTCFKQRLAGACENHACSINQICKRTNQYSRTCITACKYNGGLSTLVRSRVLRFEYQAYVGLDPGICAMFICISTYVCVSVHESVCMCTRACVCVCVCEKERETEKHRERERERVWREVTYLALL